MSVHDFHEGLWTFSPHQILHDGCGECEDRGKDVATAIAKLDGYNFQRAWARATLWNKEGAPDISKTEVPLLRALWSLQLQLERRGVPIGVLPGGDQS